MKDVIKMLLTFVIVFWLIVLHWLTVYFIGINVKVSIVMGVSLAHVDMFLLATFLVGYDKSHKASEESN